MKNCWAFFQCDPKKQKSCFMSEALKGHCWLINIPCCKMDKDTPHPSSVKKVICKSCEYYKEYNKKS